MQTQISCPNCGVPYVADIYQIIDAARQPPRRRAAPPPPASVRWPSTSFRNSASNG